MLKLNSLEKKKKSKQSFFLFGIICLSLTDGNKLSSKNSLVDCPSSILASASVSIFKYMFCG